jgi:hypothetical protein
VSMAGGESQCKECRAALFETWNGKQTACKSAERERHM